MTFLLYLDMEIVIRRLLATCNTPLPYRKLHFMVELGKVSVGGGDNRVLQRPCRRGFNEFFQQASLEGRMPGLLPEVAVMMRSVIFSS